MGDGGINNLWQANISLNSIKDADYSLFILELCKKLFGVAPALRKRKTTNTLVVSLASISVVNFLVDKGLPRGNKLENNLKIPEWILQEESYRKACVRGLVDTDGCMFIHVHRVKGKEYRNISLTFTSFSPELILQMAEIFAEFGIVPHISGGGKCIYIYRAADVAKYLEVFGTSNRRIACVYEKWRDARVVERTTLER